MKTLIDAAFSRSRVVLLVLVALIVAGVSAYVSIPKEAEPDVPIPYIYVSIFHEGISPEDSERLLVQPMERELQSLEGLKEMSSVAAEGYASINMEFEAGFDADQAKMDVRDKVDLARAELPPDTDEPRVVEVNVALFPVLSISLSGPIAERALVSIARELRDEIEELNQVLEVDIGGDREEMMEVIIDPSTLEAYNLSFTDITSLVQRNNQLIAAGAMDRGAGRMVIKVPGVIAEIEDVLNLPIKVVGDTVVTFQDVATVRRTYKDPDSYARLNSNNALVLEVTKRTGENIIETTEDVRAVIEEQRQYWPDNIEVTYLLDKSEEVRDMLGDLQNNVITAIVLVMVVIIAALGLRPAVLVGMAIPGSFLTGILVIYSMGLTMNIVVLFSLILVVGMLVDGAIVTIEMAERYMDEGKDKKEAFASAAKRMSWPIIASTATTLSVFIPLLFWPGIVGEFMKYLPITVLITLLASLFMALVFVPVLGGVVAKNRPASSVSAARTRRSQDFSRLDTLTGYTASYVAFLGRLLSHPFKVLGVAVILLVLAYTAYIVLGKGVEFFPTTDASYVQVQIHARGDLSVDEKDALMQGVEQRVLGMDGVEYTYTRTIGSAGGDSAEDLIGTIELDFLDWRIRPPSSELIDEVRRRLADVPGVRVQIQEQESGIGGGKPVQIEVSSLLSDLLPVAVQQILDEMAAIDGFEDVEDSRPLTGIEWQIDVNREEAARFGADISLLGSAVQMLTTGVMLAEYQPDDADEELDIRLRFNADSRNMEQLNQLRIPTASGQVPVSNFLTVNPAQKVGNINRIDGSRTLTIEADVADDYLVDDVVTELKERLPEAGIDERVNIVFKGEDADQQEAATFLQNAFLIAICMMLAILLVQFNSFYQSILILTAIIFSTSGVLLGLLITGNPFGIVMGGIGIIALAGIVVNNNIVLIDTFNEMHKTRGMPVKEAILSTCAQRLRPVLLTSITTILGLMPMVFGLSIDLVHRDLSIGAPSTQMWVQLASAIAGGLFFATMLTLILTPCMLMIGEKLFRKEKQMEAA